jgi:5''/3''-nucleotidase SurE
MKNRGLEILLTNDDSYTSKGIEFVANILSEYGNVSVVAPKEPHSGMSAALSLGKPLRFSKVSSKTMENGNSITIYKLSGTPADCVKMAMNYVFTDKAPDILVSGINHGSNTSSSAMYSGTLGATAEGTLDGIPSIGLSFDSHSSDPDFSVVKEFLPTIIENFLKNPPQEGVYLNVNFPNIPLEDVKGITFAAEGNGKWIKEFDQRTDPYGNNYYWMTGTFISMDNRTIADHNLLKEGYITIVPP